MVDHWWESGRTVLAQFRFFRVLLLLSFSNTLHVQFLQDLVKMLLMCQDELGYYSVGRWVGRWMGGLMFLFYVLIRVIRSYFLKVKRFAVMTWKVLSVSFSPVTSLLNSRFCFFFFFTTTIMYCTHTHSVLCTAYTNIHIQTQTLSVERAYVWVKYTRRDQARDWWKASELAWNA